MFKTIFCRFPEIFNEKTTFEEFEEICEQIKYKKINIKMKKKRMILTLIYRKISNKKYVPKHLISLLLKFCYISASFLNKF